MCACVHWLKIYTHGLHSPRAQKSKFDRLLGVTAIAHLRILLWYPAKAATCAGVAAGVAGALVLAVLCALLIYRKRCPWLCPCFHSKQESLPSSSPKSDLAPVTREFSQPSKWNSRAARPPPERQPSDKQLLGAGYIDSAAEEINGEQRSKGTPRGRCTARVVGYNALSLKCCMPT